MMAGMHPEPRHLDRFGAWSSSSSARAGGLNQVTAKIAMADIPPMTQATLRSIGGAILIGVYALWRDADLFKRDGTLVAGLACGVAFGLEFVALFIGLQ